MTARQALGASCEARPGARTGADRYRAVVDVYVLLRRPDGMILLLERSGTGYADGQLCPTSRHLEAGESVACCAVREAAEEVGVEIDPADLAFTHVVHHRNPEGQGRIGFFFTATRWAGEPVNREPHKCAGLHWVLRQPPGQYRALHRRSTCCYHPARGLLARRLVTSQAARAALAEYDGALAWLEIARSGPMEPIAAEVWAFDESFRHVLLVRHRWRGWVPQGGRVEAGETPQEAARREFREETGLDGCLLETPAAVTVRAYREGWTPTLGLSYATVLDGSLVPAGESRQPAAWTPLPCDWEGAFPGDRPRIRDFAGHLETTWGAATT